MYPPLTSLVRLVPTRLSTALAKTATLESRLLRRFYAFTSSNKKPNVVFLNAGRLDYDQQLDFSRWYQLCNSVILNRSDAVTDDEMIHLVNNQQANIVICKEIAVSDQVVDNLPESVQLICEAGTGYNNWPIELCRSRGIPVCNIPTYSTQAVAHMAITYLMNFSVSMFEQQQMLLENDRRNFTGPFTLPLHEINGQTLGLIGGAGRIGTQVAQIAVALGMNVLITSRQGQLAPHHVLYQHPQVTCTSDVNWVLQQSDYVSLHTPLNDETRASFGRAQLELMKPTAFFINTSRGGVVNEQELVEVLREGRIAGAGLDVTTTEPPSPDSPLWDLPNVWLSPHTGWRRIETRQRLVDMTADNIQAYCEATCEADLINVVN